MSPTADPIIPNRGLRLRLVALAVVTGVVLATARGTRAALEPDAAARMAG